MACLTRCVSSWETNRRCESPVHGGNPRRLTRLFSQGLIHDSSSLERMPEAL